jgi:hypothetical protein
LKHQNTTSFLLDDRKAERLDPTLAGRPDLMKGRTSMTLSRIAVDAARLDLRTPPQLDGPAFGHRLACANRMRRCHQPRSPPDRRAAAGREYAATAARHGAGIPARSAQHLMLAAEARLVGQPHRAFRAFPSVRLRNASVSERRVREKPRTKRRHDL